MNYEIIRFIITMRTRRASQFRYTPSSSPGRRQSQTIIILVWFIIIIIDFIIVFLFSIKNIREGVKKNVFFWDFVPNIGPHPPVNIRIARPRNALWRAILRRAILSLSFIRIARPIYFVCFFCVNMTLNWFQMLFRVFCIVSVHDHMS